MKKLIAFFAICMLLGVACSKQEQNSDQLGAMSFDITASTPTRTSIYSEQISLQVTDVKVYAFKKNDAGQYLYIKTITIPLWTTGQTFGRYTIPEADKLPVGSYKFLAVGRNATDPYTFPTLTPLSQFDGVSVSVEAPGQDEDIYAGDAVAEVTAGGGRVNITMTRKVSGVLAYFKNVPQMINSSVVGYLRLSMSIANTELNLTTGSIFRVVIGPLNVIDINLQGQSVSNGVYTGNTIPGVVKVDNSQLGGSFLIPGFLNREFTLGLYGIDGTTLLKSWKVSNGTSTSFPLSANNLYSLGRKLQPDNTDGGTPNDPSDDDDAIDLMVDQSLTLTILPSWDVINSLVIQ